MKGDLSMAGIIGAQSISDLVRTGQANDPQLAEYVAEIRALHKEIRGLDKRLVADIIEIGRRLSACRDILKERFGHGLWGDWATATFGWSDQTVRNYVRLYEMSRTKNFLDLDLPVSVLHLLAAPSTPEPVRTEILNLAKAGKGVSVEDVKAAIADAKFDKAPTTKAESKSAKSAGVNAKPLPDIVDGCVAVVRRRIEDTILELNRRTPPKRRAELERLFAGLADIIADLEQKALPAAEEDVAASAAKGKALYAAK
jgi:Protein of unknown function (DUF3102)